METKFISITQKAALMVSLKLGEAEAIKIVMDEINRLESVIKDYEIGIKQINDKFNSTTFKRPKTHNQ